MQQQLTKQKLAELAEDPNNRVFYYEEEDKNAPAPSLALPVATARSLVFRIRQRALELHANYPDWTAAQVQNKMRRENPDVAAFSFSHTMLWEKISLFDMPQNQMKWVTKMLDTLERQEKKEITMEEAKQLIAFYMQQQMAVKTPKRKEKKVSK